MSTHPQPDAPAERAPYDASGFLVLSVTWDDLVRPDAAPDILASCAGHLREGRHPVLYVGPPDAPVPDLERVSWLQFVGCDLLLPESASVPHALAGQVLARYVVDPDRGLVLHGRDGQVLEGLDAPRAEQWRGAAPAAVESRRRHAAIAALLVAWLALTLFGFQMSPYYAITTTPSHGVTELVELPATAAAPANPDDLRVGTAKVTQLRWAGVPVHLARAVWSPSRMLHKRYVQGDDVQLDASTEARWSFRNALAAASLAAESPATVTGTGVLVISGSGHDYRDRPEPGDVIVGAGSTPVTTLAQLRRAAQRAAAGTYLRVELEDGGQRRIWLQPEPADPTRHAFGETLETRDLEVDADFRASERPTSFEGASSGLALALHLYRSMSGDDLLQGRKVMATGAVHSDGTVVEVSATDFKAASAASEGVDVVLVPHRNFAEAQRLLTRPGGPRVVPVATVQDAIDALKGPVTLGPPA